jgi:hypothetical protein
MPVLRLVATRRLALLLVAKRLRARLLAARRPVALLRLALPSPEALVE